MNEKIIDRMSEIVEITMKRFQSDFTNYDKPYIEEAEESQFPMIWIVGEMHTHLLRLGDFEGVFNSNECVRYDCARGTNPFTPYINTCIEDKIFLVTPDEVREISAVAAHEVVRDILTPVIKKWISENGSLPTNFKVPLKFSNITLEKLKEMFRAEENRNGRTLLKTLREFRCYKRCADDHYIQISYNPGYNEFIFCEYLNGRQGLVGGIVFHGWPETGYQQNYSTQLIPSYGWSKHT